MLCPICKREVAEPAPNAPRGNFPFCSERCKLIDLGRWLGGKYQIPAVDTEDPHEGVVEPADKSEDAAVADPARRSRRNRRR